MMTDPIADMLTRMRNAITARHEHVQMPVSRMKREIARILKEEGYIREYRVHPTEQAQGTLEIDLKYDIQNNSIIRTLQRVSKPGKRSYVACKGMPKVLNGAGIAIVSTSRGLLTDQQCLAENVGGEVLCYIW
jgi:small subunit ribosomal protein S8